MSIPRISSSSTASSSPLSHLLIPFITRPHFNPKPISYAALTPPKSIQHHHHHYHHQQQQQKCFRFARASRLQCFSWGRRPVGSRFYPSSSSPVMMDSGSTGATAGDGDGDGDLIVLGIETSCDDTAAAVVRSNGEILSQVVSSQADLLSRYGGVAPKMAEEAHSKVIDQVIKAALDKAKLNEKDLTAVAVTIGPGLSLCLLVGVQKAREIAAKFQLPIVGVHHMEAHALVARLTERELQFPFVALLISGGHNLLVLARDLGKYVQLGTTIDDAIGEAYDKTAKWLGLDLRRSGGPAVEELAREGDPESIKFTIPMKQHEDCNFSYAGLKTQVRRAISSKNMYVIGGKPYE